MKPGKRIVSKARYAKIQSIRAGLNVSSVCFMLLAYGCGLVTLYFLFIILAGSDIPACLESALVSGSLTLLFTLVLIASIRKTEALERVIPITRANTADLPSHDSLVRASEEPKDEQTNVLLHAVIDVNPTLADQLLRPSLETLEP